MTRIYIELSTAIDSSRRLDNSTDVHLLAMHISTSFSSSIFVALCLSVSLSLYLFSVYLYSPIFVSSLWCLKGFKTGVTTLEEAQLDKSKFISIINFFWLLFCSRNVKYICALSGDSIHPFIGLQKMSSRVCNFISL